MDAESLSGWFDERVVEPEIIALRLGVAAVFGMLIGLDREARDRPAGLRTQMLVAVASAMFAILALELVPASAELADTARTDPIRLVEAVVAGVAFLGAGTIIQSRNHVKGVTTGASLWMSGAIGLACGLGYFALATVGVAYAMFILIALGWLERRAEKAGAFPASRPRSDRTEKEEGDAPAP